MGTKINIGGLDISWFMDVVLENVIVKDKSGRNILKAERIKFDLGKLSRKDHFIGIYAVSLKKAEINIIRNASDSLMNYNFILQYFSGTDTSTADSPSADWRIGISGIGLKDCRFVYRNELRPKSVRGVDYNFISISSLNLDLRKLAVSGDSITANINRLSLREKSGFVLDGLTAGITVKPDEISARDLHIQTPSSNIRLNLSFIHSGYDAYNDFIDSVRMQGIFSETTLNLNDISFFAPEITGMDNEIRFKGIVKGTVSSLKARHFSLTYGTNTFFDGNINMDGLPDIEETFIHLKVKKLITDYDDLSGIKLPGNSELAIPEALKVLGQVNINGYFTGFYNDFVSSANFNTGLGTLITDLSLKMSNNKIIDYNGHLNLVNWDLGRTFSREKLLGKVDFASAITGRITDYTTFDVNMDAVINSIWLYGNTFQNINIDGDLKNREFNGALSLKNRLIDFDFSGVVNFTDSLPKMNFTSTVKDAYLSRLNLWDRDSTSCLSTRMDLDFTGTNIDNLLGSLRFDNTTYAEKGKIYKVSEVSLIKSKDNSGNRTLDFRSDFMDVNFNGIFSFADFFNSFSNIISAYLPSVQPAERQTHKIEKEQLFDYTIHIKNVDPLTELFLPGFIMESEANMFGSFNSASETILLNGQAGSFIYNGIRFNDWFIRGQNVGHTFELQTGASGILWKEPDEEDERKLGVENFSIKAFMEGDSVRYTMKWENNDTINLNKGMVDGTMLFTGPTRISASFDKTDLIINNVVWTARQDGGINIDSTMISVDNLIVNGNNQELKLNGKISENPLDMFSLWFENLDISNADALINRNDLNFDGIVTGKVTLTDFYAARTIQSDLTIGKFAFNGEKMGDARLRSWWDKKESGLGIDANLVYHGNAGIHNPLIVKGFIYPGKRDNGNFDLEINLVNYKLASLNPFLSGFASNLKGMANGDLSLTGTFEKPEITGDLQLIRTQMKIDYLNVTYSLADKVNIEHGLISANDVKVYDSLGNSGLCDFRLTHDHFRNMMLDMSVTAKNLAGLNTTFRQNELFYGTAFASGVVSIKGPFDDLRMNIRVRSEPQTNVFIPINLSVDATENEYIKFINKEEPDNKGNTFEANTKGLNLDMMLDVTRDANIQIFLPEDIGNIKGNGTGEISMGIDTRGDFTMFGDYIMNSGTFLFTFRNIINRVFTIENGSIISFRGSPYDADIDLRAVYKLRASLKSIPELADMPEYAGKTIPVDCIISLENNLYNPDIGFSIRLPEADETLKQLVFSSIDTTNEASMTQQMVSLLVLKSFSFSGGNANLASTVGSSSIEMITNQLSNMLSQISKDVDIGLNYRTGDALSSEELELALSTHLFNDRVTIDGNVGMTTAGSTQNTNNLVGDVTVDVKITPDGRFRVKAFNKANNPFDISSSYATYRQGVGIYYKFEFDRFSEIFRRSRKNLPTGF
ncbi:MAG: translocation/assembly module TamB domain-containing protein [Bacteroidota bacterium]